MAEFKIVRRGQIEAEFTGWDGDTLFALTDGSHFIQAEYAYWYHYAYRPHVEILERGGRLYLRLAGTGRLIAVHRANVLADSQIAGAFQGWSGDTEYTLTNGQRWRQSAYHYTYTYSYRPQAVVYEAPSGTVMAVSREREREFAGRNDGGRPVPRKLKVASP